MAFISQIKAGDFNIRLKLKSSSVVTNSFGEQVRDSYSTEQTFWGIKRVTSLRSVNEKFEGDQLQSYGLFFIQVRYNSDFVENLDPTWRLEDDATGEKYEILSYIIDPRKEWVEFYTKIDINNSIA